MWLSDNEFLQVVSATPLVSIDLVIRERGGKVLLGKRLNRPAQGDWFVPGGRIRKNETLDDAFRRLTREELGQPFERVDARLLNVYEHFYRDSVFGDRAGIDTHYVVLGYCLELPDGCGLSLPEQQHSEYRWWTVGEMTTSPDVHANSRAYLQD